MKGLNSMPFELETAEGEILLFATQDEMIEYVLSRMIENGQLTVTGRDAENDIVVKRNTNS